MGDRRAHGTGCVYQGSDGYWRASIYVGHRRVVRRRWTEADALEAVAELIEAHKADLGYFYRSARIGERFPKVFYKGLPPSQYPRRGVTARVRFRVFERDDFRCVYCGAGGEGVCLVVDHVRPVTDGGTDDFDNLATACATCNAGKAGRPLLTLPPTLANRR